MFYVNLSAYIVTTMFTLYSFIGIELLYFKFHKVYNRFYPSLENPFVGVSLMVLFILSTFCVVVDSILGIQYNAINGSTIMAFVHVVLLAGISTFFITYNVVKYLDKFRVNMPSR